MADPLFSVIGQIVVVSGGSRGIGRAIAQGFAERGATVVIMGRDQQTLDQTARQIAPQGTTVHTRTCDVAETGDIRASLTWLLEQFGHIDTLVNVAGVNRRKPALEVTEDD